MPRFCQYHDKILETLPRSVSLDTYCLRKSEVFQQLFPKNYIQSSVSSNNENVADTTAMIFREFSMNLSWIDSI